MKLKGIKSTLKCSEYVPSAWNNSVLLSGKCSNKTCLHAPQGLLNSPFSVWTDMDLKFVIPSAIALQIATRSAQSPLVQSLTSTLTPEIEMVSDFKITYYFWQQKRIHSKDDHDTKDLRNTAI